MQVIKVKDLVLAGLCSVLIYTISTVMLNTQAFDVLAQTTTEKAQAQTETEVEPKPENIPPQELQNEASIDPRITKLENYLNSKKSPLAPYAATFVLAADTNELDYRMLPAITGIESSFGVHLIPASHNPFGWGGGRIYFKDYNEAIFKVANGLKKGYVDRGAKTVNQIAPIYCPPNAQHWAGAVNSIMNQIEKI